MVGTYIYLNNLTIFRSTECHYTRFCAAKRLDSEVIVLDNIRPVIHATRGQFQMQQMPSRQNVLTNSQYKNNTV